MKKRSVAQLVRAPTLGVGGRRFESRYSDKIGQTAENGASAADCKSVPFVVKNGGSNPSLPTINKRNRSLKTFVNSKAKFK